MIRYSSEVTIDRPPQAVYAALLDPLLYPKWTDMVDVTFDDADGARVGTRGRFRLASGPIKGTLEMEVVELEPDRRVVIHVTHPNLDWTSVSTLEAVGPGTRLTYAGEMGLLGWRRLLEPLAAREVRAGEAAEAVRLKALLEADASERSAVTSA
jgi:carbon monoxide dehydrogenase subunit G